MAQGVDPDKKRLKARWLKTMLKPMWLRARMSGSKAIIVVVLKSYVAKS